MISPTRLLSLMLAGLAAPAAAQSEAYQLTPPSGWTRSEENGALVLTPPGPDAASARIIVYPPKPLDADFEAQAARERSSIERALGLRDPRPASVRRAQTSSSERHSYHATYASEGGDRHVGFFSLAEKKTFALVVFYTSSRQAYGRLAPPAQALFLGLRIVDRAPGGGAAAK